MSKVIIGIDETNVDEVVRDSWTKVKELVEGGHPLSSEKTLCFLFAMEMWRYCDGRIQMDFENYCYQDLPGKSKYLDLFVRTSNDFKVAFEFKLPQKSKTGNSNQTANRAAVYRDLARLKWLKNNSINVNAAYFLMATNENAYVNNTNVGENPHFLTRHGHKLFHGHQLEVDGLTLENIDCQFCWSGIDERKPARATGKYAWLEPILV